MHAGYRVGQFILERRLGEGGMAEVWLGRNVHLGSLAAVKFLNEQYATREDIAGRFLNEGRRQGALDHPNIVKVYGFDYAEGRSFLIMQFVDGEALDQRLQRTGPMNIAQALPIANGILQALEFAHNRHIVHRDVKPSNVLIDGQGTAYLGDFGIVLAVNEKRLTQTGTVMGTPHYMSPEQIARPMDIDHRSDIYSFGCVLYEMLTGATPFDHVSSAPGDTDFAVKMAHLQTPPPLPRQRNSAIPEAVERIIMQCLAKDPGHRFANCGQVRQALAHATTQQMPPIIKPRRVWPAVVGLALLAMGGGAAAYWPKQPAVEMFLASPATVVKGQATLLQWSVRDAKTVQISGLGRQPAIGSAYVKPDANMVFLLTGENVWKKAERSLPIRVVEGARIVKYELTPATVRPNEEATLSWEVVGATRLTIGTLPVGGTGKLSLRVTETTGYTIRATGADGVMHQDRRVLEVVRTTTPPQPQPKPAAPEIIAFDFAPRTIYSGGSTALYWDIRGATRVTINNRVQPVKGNLPLARVDRNLTADLVAEGPGGRTAKSVTLTVQAVSVPRPASTLQIVTFRSTIIPGSQGTTVNLTYDVPGATRVVIEPEGGTLTQSRGTVSVFPTRPTVYTLTAFGPNGETVKGQLQVNINVYGTPQRPEPPQRGASWNVTHHHSSTQGRGQSCYGTLFVQNGRLIFQSRTGNDGFDVPFSEVADVKTNRFLLGATANSFLVKTGTQNYNFITNDSAETVVAQIKRAIGQ